MFTPMVKDEKSNTFTPKSREYSDFMKVQPSSRFILA